MTLTQRRSSPQTPPRPARSPLAGVRRRVVRAAAPAGAVVLAVSCLQAGSLTPAIDTLLFLTVLALLAVGARLSWHHHPVMRLRRRLGHGGWMDWWQWHGHASARALRAAGQQLRPGLTNRPRDPTTYGALVGRLVSGHWWMRWHRCYTRWSQGVLVLGPPGSGKTQWLVGPILDAPGPCYVTSTKTELAELTGQLRSRTGPGAVFNPAGLGELVSTFRWDPVAGCADPRVADARARALIRGGGGVAGSEQADFWAGKAAEILRCYLLAAALHRRDMGQVMEWSLRPEQTAPAAILAQHPHQVPAGWLGSLQANLTADPRTRSGYFAALTPAVTFMDSEIVAESCRPGPGEQFDIEEFLRTSGTVYVIAGDDRRLAPLLTALTEAVFGTAQRVAAASGGRLDPPLSMFLDEIAQITPVPLDRWAADSRGWGVTIYAVLQDLHQAQTRWGRSRAQTIFSTLPTKVVLPGVSVKEDLEALAYLAGHRAVTRTSDHHGAKAGAGSGRSQTTSTATEAVATGHILHALPRWHAFVVGLAPAAAVVRYEPGYRRVRRELRALGKCGVRLAPLTTAAAPPRLRAVPDGDKESGAA
jgi:hypothetical protein